MTSTTAPATRVATPDDSHPLGRLVRQAVRVTFSAIRILANGLTGMADAGQLGPDPETRLSRDAGARA